MANIRKFNTYPYTTFVLIPDIDSLHDMKKPAMFGIIWNDSEQEQDVVLSCIGQSQVKNTVSDNNTPRYYIRALYDRDIICPEEIRTFFETHYIELLNKINKDAFECLEDAIKLITDYIKEVF